MKRSLISCGLMISLFFLPGCSVLRQVNHVFLTKPKRHSVMKEALAADSLRNRALAVRPEGKILDRSVLTEIARDQLASGNFGLAAETFGLAREAGEPLGPILNGLGVAYANIGRADVAAHNFRLAIAADPQEERYRWNLAKLLARTEMAQTRDRNVQTAHADHGSVIVEPKANGALVEIAPRQFMIRTIPGAKPTARTAEAPPKTKAVATAQRVRVLISPPK